MTKEERERKRIRVMTNNCKEAGSVTAFISVKSLVSLLDALDKAEARIKALEKALYCHSYICDHCINKDRNKAQQPCKSCIDDEGHGAWQFDHKRFEG